MHFNIHEVLVIGLVLAAITTSYAESRGIQSRIISGKPSAVGQFPYYVILKKDEDDSLLCGGSIISPNWVLTAAHCTYGLSSIFCTFGTNLLNDPNALSMTSSSIQIHPDYNNANLNNDVSLIKLPQTLTFSDTISAINLVPSTAANSNLQGTTATIAGFGLTDDEYLEFSPTLLYAQVTIIENSQCAAVYGTEIVQSSTLCGKGYDGSNMSICSGDSGGPLVANDANGNAMQIGINSFVAQDMCTEGYPSGYARLTSYLSYIYQITGIS